MKIVKFGGSSVSSPDRIRGVKDIVKHKYEQGESLAVVLSAFGGVTDEFVSIGRLAMKRGQIYREPLKKLEARHLDAAASLISNVRKSEVFTWIQQQFLEIEEILKGISLLGELSTRSLDLIMSFGERLCAFIFSESLREEIPQIVYVDAREIIKTDRHFGSARVDYQLTNRLIQDRLKNHFLPIITGFIASTQEEETTTLGRGGSDFTAAIIGAALDAKEIEIWTDVNGVMTADPRKVSQAFTIPEMSYQEALEMSHFGAKVIYPPTIVPAMRKNIPIRIKNTFAPEASGTYISHRQQIHPAQLCGIASIDRLALLRVEGSGLIGVAGVAMRLFGALAKHGISVILISQASSEHSICLAVKPADAQEAKQAIESEFTLEAQVGLIDPVNVEQEMSIVAAVGEGMRETPGIAGRFFGALGRNGVNVAAIAQGSSELNISVVIRSQDESKALNAIHEEFFSGLQTTLHVYLIGTGLIGSALLGQLNRLSAQIQRDHGVHIRLIGLANSQKMMFQPQGISLDDWEKELKGTSETMKIGTFLERMKGLNLTNSIFVDCTANEEIAAHYPTILRSHISIVTPNKKANSSSYVDYLLLKDLSKQRGVQFLYEANVGAGLPVISTIIHLLRSGDKILRIEAILSGTLSYLFNHFTPENKFSELVREAHAKGFTEPDPREDLNGQDVLRKLLILARESGYPLEMADIRFTPFLPKECFAAASMKEFYARLAQCDALMADLEQEAAKDKKRLRFIARLDQGKATVALQAVNAQHPFYYLSGNDNVIAITTERYDASPLVIKGQGAGAEVTAGEVLADIVRLGRVE